MNIDTGELFNVANDEQLKELKEAYGDAIKKVPLEHQKEAKKKLKDNDYVTVDMTENTPLVKWANKENQKRKKNRKKMAKASRKKNR